MNTLLKNITLAVVTCLMLWACAENDDLQAGKQAGEGALLLGYEVNELPGTRAAVDAGAGETEIKQLYALFFRGTGDQKYLGYSRTTVSDPHAAKGSIRVNVPYDEDVYEPWHILFVANLDYYVPGGDAPAWLEDGRLQKDVTAFANAEANLKATALATGIETPMLMTGSTLKASGDNSAIVLLQRRIVRIDVENQSSDLSVGAVALWNARSESLLTDKILETTGAGSFLNFQWWGPDNNNANLFTGKLYTFANAVVKPAANDTKTTCLMIKARWKGGSEKYYRINLALPDEGQYLKHNQYYKLIITAALTDGYNTANAAYTAATSTPLEYSINSWGGTDMDMDDYVFDGEGHGMKIAQREVVFNESPDQLIDLKVSTFINTTSNALTTPTADGWTVRLDDVENFSVERTGSSSAGYSLRIKAIKNNDTSAPRQAKATLKWSGVELSVNITQLPAYSMQGLKIEPMILETGKAGVTKHKIYLSYGDGSRLDKTNVQALEPVWVDGYINWFSVVGSPVQDGNKVYYELTVDAITLDGIDIRRGKIQFQATGAQIVHSTVLDVVQTYTTVIPEDKPLDYKIYLADRAYNFSDQKFANLLTLRGTASGLLKGLPDTKPAATTLQFPALHPDQLVYVVEFSSKVATSSISVTMGGTNASSFEAVPKGDRIYHIVSKGAMGLFDTDRTATVKVKGGATPEKTYNIYQGGVMGRLPNKMVTRVTTSGGKSANVSYPDDMYYYEPIKVINQAGNEEIWLDRNLGAVLANKFHSHWPDLGESFADNKDDKVGEYIGVHPNYLSNPMSTLCPPGFRLPLSGVDDAELFGLFKYKLQVKGTAPANYLSVRATGRNGSENDYYIPALLRTTGNYYFLGDFNYYDMAVTNRSYTGYVSITSVAVNPVYSMVTLKLAGNMGFTGLGAVDVQTGVANGTGVGYPARCIRDTR